MRKLLTAFDTAQRRLWIAFAVLCASVIVHLGFYLIDHRSTSFLVLAALTAAVAIGGIVASAAVSYALTPERLSALRIRAARWRNAYLVIAFGITFAFGLDVRPEWIYAHIVLMLGAGLVLGYVLLYADAPPLGRRWAIAAGVVAVGATLIRLYGLSYYPSHIIIDEPWDLGWALSYLQRGYFTDSILYYGGADIQRFMLPVAWWISFVGVGFWQVRLFFFLLIFPLIGFTVLAARNWSISGIVVAMFMFSSAIVMSAARIRHDIGLGLALAASLWLYTEAEKRHKNILHLLAGLMIGLGLFAHYHAILFGVALTISLYVPDAVARWRRDHRRPTAQVVYYIAGGLLGAGIVFLFQILPDWQHFVDGRQPRNPTSLLQFVNGFIAHWGSIAGYSQIELVLIVAALAVALWRRRRIDIKLALLVVTLHIALALQAVEAYVYYVVPLTPVYALIIGALFTDLPSVKQAWVPAAFFCTAALGLTLHTPFESVLSRSPVQLPMPPVAQWLRENVAPTESIVAEHWYYLWLTDYPFISTLSISYAPPSIQAESPEAVWDRIAPDVVVIDRNLSTCCVPPILTEDYLKSRGYQEIAELPGDTYPVLVYEKSGAPPAPAN